METYQLEQENLLHVSEIEIVYNPLFKATERPQVKSSNDLYTLLMQNWNTNKICLREEFKIILLNSNNRVLGISTIGTGGTAAVYIDRKLILSTALLANASAIILAHNHPSGNLNPSNADIETTKKIIEACKILDIAIFDHIIITKDNGYFSFADKGLI